MSRLESQDLRLSSLDLNGIAAASLTNMNKDFNDTRARIAPRKKRETNPRSKLIERMTINLCDTFKTRNSHFDYRSSQNPKRVLTKPSTGAKNDGFDNENSDYILYVHDILDNRFEILEMLGSGTFGQVARCRCLSTGKLKAVKIIKNKPAYLKQSTVEVEILKQLNTVFDPNDIHNILRMEDSFMHKNHLCIVFELLSVNLYELIKQNNFKGLSINLVRVFSTQILETLCILQDAKVIHCDLKPENILLKSLEVPSIKVIDFGSACFEYQQMYSYIQSRFYRSPEVLLGLKYTTAIDMWSFGCIVAELFLGLPIFPGSSEYNQLTRITETMGDIPNHMIINGKNGHRFYNYSKSNDSYTLKDIYQYSEERQKNEKPSKRYFSTFNLDRLILKYPLPRNDMSLHEKEKEMDTRRLLLDFLKKILEVDPEKRFTPKQAQDHPFIASFAKTYQLQKQQEHSNTASLQQEQEEEKKNKKQKQNENRQTVERRSIIDQSNSLTIDNDDWSDIDTSSNHQPHYNKSHGGSTINETNNSLTSITASSENNDDDGNYNGTYRRRKSYAVDKHGSASVSPVLQNKYGTTYSPLISPPLENGDCMDHNQDYELNDGNVSGFSGDIELPTYNQSNLRHRAYQ